MLADEMDDENDEDGEDENGGNGGAGSGSSNIRVEVEDLIMNQLPQIPYPPAMFDTVRTDTFNDFVLRFLREEQTSEDHEALKGLITSMT